MSEDAVSTPDAPLSAMPEGDRGPDAPAYDGGTINAADATVVAGLDPAGDGTDTTAVGLAEVDDVGYLLHTFRIDDMSLRNVDGSVDRRTLDNLMAAHRHLIADRIRIPDGA